MKRIIKYISILIISMFILSVKVDALSASLSTNKGTVKKGETFNISLNVSDVGEGLGSFTYSIAYDSSLFEFKSSTKCSTCQFNNPSDLRYAYLDISGSSPFMGGNVGTMTFTAKETSATKTGLFTLTSKGIKSKSGSLLTSNNSNVSVQLLVPSTNADLSSLTASGINLSPAFNKDVMSYTGVTDSASTTISANKSDNTATISGSGFKNLNYGTNTFNIVVTSQAGNTKTYKITITRNDNRSKNNNLKSLKVTNGNIPFNENKTDYNITLDSNVSYLELSATASDSKAKVSFSPSNRVSIDYGKSATITVSVTAENGSVKTYRVTATRKDDRDTNNNLKSLTVSNTNIKFNGSANYTYTVTNDKDNVNINAVAQSGKAKVAGAGSKRLNVGSNRFTVSVTAENGSVKNYIITIIRKAKDGEKLNLSNNNNLSSLEIDGVNLDFNKDMLNYTISVANNIESLNIKYQTEDPKATVTVEKPDSLKIGLNNIIVKVVAENGEVKSYNLAVTREELMLTVNNNEDEIIKLIESKDVEDLIHVRVKESDKNKVISKKVLSKLKENKKSIVYEVVNESNGILYQIKIDGSNISDKNDFDYTIEYIKNNILKTIFNNNYIAFKLKGKLPGKVSMGILIDELDSNNLELFKVENEKAEKYSSLDIKDNYAEYEIEDNDMHVISSLVKESKLSSGKIILLSSILAIVVIAIITVIVVMKKKNKDEDVKTEDMQLKNDE